MADVKRGYDTTRRRAQAEATRQDVLDAAGRLFATRGYAATTIDEIAADAGVSRETIFKAFGTKRQLLRLWVERQIAGPEEPVPIQQQGWMDQIREAREQRTQVEIGVAATRRIYDRAAEAIDVMGAAAHAEPEIAALWDEARRRRHQDVRTVTDRIAATGPARPDLIAEEVVDVFYALTSPEFYDLLVRQCGWRPDRYEEWLVDAICRLALVPPRD